MMTDIETARADYDRDGVCLLRGAFGKNWLQLVADGIEEALQTPGPNAEKYGPPGEERFFGDLDMWQRHEPLRDYVLNSPAGELAGRVMRSNTARFLYDQMLVKEPGSQQRTPWHQDQPYWAVAGSQVCSIWMPLDPVPREVALEFVAGSHKTGKIFSPNTFADGKSYEGTGLPPVPDIEANRSTFPILSWDLEPGDCLIFSAMILHGAPANPTTGRRRVLSTRWLGDDARFVKPHTKYQVPTQEPDFAEGLSFTGDLYPLVWSQ